jgi:hypothetical protein
VIVISGIQGARELNSTSFRLTIDHRKISWLKFILESYEGLAIPVTLDGASGRILLLIGPGAETEVMDLIAAIKDELGLIEGLSDELGTLGQGRQWSGIDFKPPSPHGDQ